MIFYVVVGGMKGTTYVQIVKAFMLMIGAAVMTILVFAAFNFNLSDLLGEAATKSGKGEAFLQPGRSTEVAGMRHLLQQDRPDFARHRVGAGHRRPAAHPDPVLHRADGQTARESGAVGDRHHRLLLPDDAGARFRRRGNARHGRRARSRTRAATRPRHSWRRRSGRFFGGEFGGTAFLAVIAAVAFATILAVVAGLTLASSSSLAHDFYANVVKKGRRTEREEVVVARIAAFVIGAISIVLAILARDLNVAFLVALAFAVAASGNLPAILYSLFWKRFTTRGATWAIYGGLGTAVVLVFFSPVVSGTATAIFNCRTTGRGSRCPTPASSRSRRASSSAGSAPSPPTSRRPRSATPSSRFERSPAQARRQQRRTPRPSPSTDDSANTHASGRPHRRSSGRCLPSRFETTTSRTRHLCTRSYR